MQAHDLKRILSAFANVPRDVEVKQGKAIAQIQDEIIDVSLERDSNTGELVIVDNDVRFAPLRWLLVRVAKMPLLAERILSFIPPTDHFVTPSGVLQEAVAVNDEEPKPIANVVAGLQATIDKQPPGTTSVVYLTSDAGEGKTTTINHLARRQAELYRERGGCSLLIPIPLGGKAFLHFDDVVVATLVNKLRFNYYYYEGFLELIRLGAIVPAFDGFEEMFIEGSSGEAISALGNLINSLDSSGMAIVAARTAFFDYQSFRTQARLFDSIEDKSVSFSRVGINRWGKSQFLAYADQRGATDAEEIFNAVAKRFESVDHPLLTRAVLVSRLFDVVATLGDTEELLQHLGKTPQDYFFNFVDALVSREANEKWLDKSAGDAKEPLLKVSEHHEILSQIATEMWLSSAFSLRHDIIDVIIDLFADGHGKSLAVRRQLKERIKQHSLLVTDAGKGGALRFDHDDFRLFYLGEALGTALFNSDRAELLTLLTANQVPAETCDQALQHLRRHELKRDSTIATLIDIARAESTFSYAKENCGALIVRVLDSETKRDSTRKVAGLTFPAGSLSGRTFSGIEFQDCYFQPTSIQGSKFEGVIFRNCEFERIEIGATTSIANWTFIGCLFGGLVAKDTDRQWFGPNEIRVELARRGGKFDDAQKGKIPPLLDDPRVHLVERFLRLFLRMTQVDDSLVRSKVGRSNATQFFDDVLPALMKAGVVIDVPHRGSGVQRRFRLGVRMQSIQEALSQCEGSFENFLLALQKKNS